MGAGCCADNPAVASASAATQRLARSGIMASSLPNAVACTPSQRTLHFCAVNPPDNVQVVLQGATGYLKEIQQLFKNEGLACYTGAIPGSG